jgi:hypothetical protein
VPPLDRRLGSRERVEPASAVTRALKRKLSWDNALHCYRRYGARLVAR